MCIQCEPLPPKTHKAVTAADRVANYLFGEMCSHSPAGHDDKGLETWYEAGFEFYETVLDAPALQFSNVAG